MKVEYWKNLGLMTINLGFTSLFVWLRLWGDLKEEETWKQWRRRRIPRRKGTQL